MQGCCQFFTFAGRQREILSIGNDSDATIGRVPAFSELCRALGENSLQQSAVLFILNPGGWCGRTCGAAIYSELRWDGGG